MDKRKVNWILYISLLAAALMVMAAFSLGVGSVRIPLGRIVPAILQGKGTSDYSILVHIRLPRILLGIFIGGALSLAGVMLQGMFRNPLVEPYTLGISGGAALGVGVCIVTGLSRLAGMFTLPFFGFAGAVSVIILVYTLSIRRGMLRAHGMLLTGVMISFISSSLMMLMMAVSKSEDLHGIVFWIMGSLEEPGGALILLTAAVSLAGLGASYMFCHELNAFSLGEEEARHLGVNVEIVKRMLFVISSLLTGVCVSVAGIIGFIGLVVPHFVRMLVGSDHRILLVSAYLSGAVFLVFCDTLSRTMLAPVELPVGVITGILGGILFVYALNMRSAEAAGKV
ncbi:MAG: iron ABC transporter permease [Elusimicrobia bacterium]|nr:iron ABC transporter permease [Elusimicrobiota bacterium]